jgi:hypothetical protein
MSEPENTIPPENIGSDSQTINKETEYPITRKEFDSLRENVDKLLAHLERGGSAPAEDSDPNDEGDIDFDNHSHVSET